MSVKVTTLLDELNLSFVKGSIGKLNQMTDAQRSEYLEMIHAVASKPRDARPPMEFLSDLVSKKFGITIAPRTVNTHVLKEAKKIKAHSLTC